MKRTSRILALACAAPLILSGCFGKDEPPKPAAKPPATAAKAPPKPLSTAVSAAAWLRGELPADAVAYLRIPSPWGMLAAPKGSVLSNALNSDANIQAVEAIQAAFAKRVNAEPKPEDMLGFDLLVDQLRSPLEAALLLPPDAQLPSAQLLLSATLASPGLDAFNALMQRITDADPRMRLVHPASDAAPGLLQAGPLQVFFRFQPKEHRAFFLAGLATTADALDKTLAALKPNTAHPMLAAEKQIDTSRQGLFVWLDGTRLVPLAMQGMPPQQQAQFKQSGLDTLRSLALGWGVADGKGRLRLLADVPGAPWFKAQRGSHNDLSLQAAGAPHAVALLSLPDRATALQLESMLFGGATPAARARLEQATKSFKQRMGMPPSGLLDIFGPELIAFSDDAGEYTALAVRDEKGLQALEQHLAAQPDVLLETRKVDGVEIHHLAMRSMGGLRNMFGDGKRELPPALQSMLAGLRDQFYWIRDGHYLVFAGVPQALLDHAKAAHHQGLGEWLAKTQHQPAADAVALASTRIDNIPRRVYYAYLQTLSALADASGAKVDLFTLPTAHQLGLPKDGAIGASLQVNGSQYSVEASFENNPLEFMLNPQMGSVAVVGVLAAIAIPAYNEYTARAHVSEGLRATAPLRAYVGDYYGRHHRYPSTKLAAAVNAKLAQEDTPRYAVRLVGGSGEITVTFQLPTTIAGRHLLLTPQPGEQGLRWGCGADMDKRYLPRVCR